MKMTASTRHVDGVTIVDLGGRIVVGEGTTGVRDLVRNLIKAGNKKILLNLRDVDYVDSSGLGELVHAFTSMRRQGGELKLLNLSKRVRALLQITKLLTVFDITDDEATSVKSFSPAICAIVIASPSCGRALSLPLPGTTKWLLKDTVSMSGRGGGGTNPSKSTLRLPDLSPPPSLCSGQSCDGRCRHRSFGFATRLAPDFCPACSLCGCDSLPTSG